MHHTSALAVAPMTMNQICGASTALIWCSTGDMPRRLWPSHTDQAAGTEGVRLREQDRRLVRESCEACSATAKQ